MEANRSAGAEAGTGAWAPRICENVPDISDRTLRWAAQLGIGWLALPHRVADPDGAGAWTAEACRAVVERVRAAGLDVGIVMFNLSPLVVWGQPGREEVIDRMIASIRAAGEAGFPVVEYNFYNHRAVEGYGDQPGRGGCRYTDYDDARMRPLSPRPEMPDLLELTAEQTWEHFAYFLRAVVPVAEAAGVRLAVHPNDPPPPTSRGAAQVLGSLEGMQRLVDLVPSVSNGITLCQGSFSEWPGMDIVAAIHYFGSRDKIHHVHYRNPRGTFPTYVETWIDEGDTDMLRAMQAYRDVGYRFTLCSD
ncbi:MAG: mannonate dehydratase, partial [Chloroflexota bacterium]